MYPLFYKAYRAFYNNRIISDQKLIPVVQDFLCVICLATVTLPYGFLQFRHGAGIF